MFMRLRGFAVVVMGRASGRVGNAVGNTSAWEAHVDAMTDDPRTCLVCGQPVDAFHRSHLPAPEVCDGCRPDSFLPGFVEGSQLVIEALEPLRRNGRREHDRGAS